MRLFRLLISLLLTFVLSLTCGQNVAGSLDQQIAERASQYQESLRLRTAQLSPSLQTKIESQTQKMVTKELEKWKKGEVCIQVALPRRAESRRIAQFLARHLPFSDSPAGSFVFGGGILSTALTVSTGQHVVKPFTIPVFDLMTNRSFITGGRQSGNILSFFIRIVSTIVQRR